MPQRQSSDEETPLLRPDGAGVDAARDTQPTRKVQFPEGDEGDPRAWKERRKMTNVAIVALMAILSPLASSMFTPGISQIAEDLNTSEQSVIATTTGFVICLGLGPLILAPLSETFGRRPLYICCFAIFSLLQAASALSPNIAALIALRTIAGLFGSVGIANGGGTINDMYLPSQRAGVYGWYLLGPLLGPTLGPLFGGVIVSRLNWRWIYWVRVIPIPLALANMIISQILTIVCALNTAVGYFFLQETYVPVLLGQRKRELEEESDEDIKYHYDGEDLRPLSAKVGQSMKRPLVIFAQPIVLTMSLYQALIFGTTYSIYTNMQSIFSDAPYNLNSEQVGLLYLGPGLGFLVAVRGLVPRIDTIFNELTERNDGVSKPEFRLPLAIFPGSVLIPAGLISFAWLVEYRVHWAACITATFFYGIGQVVIINTVQNYYIDSFSQYAASAIAGGSVLRSLIGGIMPLFSPMLFEKLGYGWGISCFGFLGILIAPSPLLFYYYGERIRERFRLNL